MQCLSIPLLSPPSNQPIPSHEKDPTDINTLFAYLGSPPLETLNGETWQSVTAGNYSSKISSSYSSGFTTITPIPEPVTCTLLSLTLGALLVCRRGSRSQSPF